MMGKFIVNRIASEGKNDKAPTYPVRPESILTVEGKRLLSNFLKILER
ncbi:MAG: hypothetical protein AB1656_07710 [Candidatus Omnitrophota bacterium]